MERNIITSFSSNTTVNILPKCTNVYNYIVYLTIQGAGFLDISNLLLLDRLLTFLCIGLCKRAQPNLRIHRCWLKFGVPLLLIVGEITYLKLKVIFDILVVVSVLLYLYVHRDVLYLNFIYNAGKQRSIDFVSTNVNQLRYYPYNSNCMVNRSNWSTLSLFTTRVWHCQSITQLFCSVDTYVSNNNDAISGFSIGGFSFVEHMRFWKPLI